MGAAASVSTTTRATPHIMLRFAQNELTKPSTASDVLPQSALAEVQRLRQALCDPMPLLSNGKIQINYQMYDSKFDIINGQIAPGKDFVTGIEKLDDEYAFSFAMPGCILDLVRCTLGEKIEREAKGLPIPFVEKNEEGTEFIGLHVLDTYWVVVHENDEQAKLAAERYAQSLLHDGIAKNEGQREVGCSCIEGNPCTEGNKYNCKNWEMRFAIAKENGWDGN